MKNVMPAAPSDDASKKEWELYINSLTDYICDNCDNQEACIARAMAFLRQKNQDMALIDLATAHGIDPMGKTGVRAMQMKKQLSNDIIRKSDEMYRELNKSIFEDDSHEENVIKRNIFLITAQIARDPLDPNGYCAKALEFMKLGEFKQARQYFLKAQFVDIQCVHAEKGLLRLENLVDKDPDNPTEFENNENNQSGQETENQEAIDELEAELNESAKSNNSETTLSH